MNGELTWGTENPSQKVPYSNLAVLGGVDTSKYTGSIGYTYVVSLAAELRVIPGIDAFSAHLRPLLPRVRTGASTSPSHTALRRPRSCLPQQESLIPVISSDPAYDFQLTDQFFLGTTLILLATNAITKYKSATGAVDDSATGLLRITSAQYASLQSLFFNIGGVCVNASLDSPEADFPEIGFVRALCKRADLAPLVEHCYRGNEQQYLSRCRRPWEHIWPGTRFYQRLYLPRTLLLRFRHHQQARRLRDHGKHLRDHQLS